jgi:hypothetical protein
MTAAETAPERARATAVRLFDMEWPFEDVRAARGGGPGSVTSELKLRSFLY